MAVILVTIRKWLSLSPSLMQYPHCCTEFIEVINHNICEVILDGWFHYSSS